MNTDHEAISRSELFSGYSLEELEVLLEQIPGKHKSYPDGSLIAQAGDLINALHLVLSGSVRGEMMDLSGKVIRIEEIPASRILAPAFIFDARPAFPVNLQASGEVLLYSIPREDFLALMQSQRRILENFLRLVSGRGRFLSGKIRLLSLSSLRGRLAYYLLEQSRQQGSTTIRIEHSQNQLSEMFGVARPSIARSLGELRKEAYIATRGKEIEILDPEGLRQLLEDSLPDAGD